MRDVVPFLLHVGEPRHLGERSADLIDHVDRRVLALAKLVDERHALPASVRLPGLELGDLLEDFPRGALLRAAPPSMSLELRRLLTERPVAPAESGQRARSGSGCRRP